MVFKASPYGPLSNLLMADLVAKADLPPGVVNVVTGQSNAIAEVLVTDPRIDKISFTGSVATGRKIIQASASNLKRVHLELGGKSVSIFLDPDNDMAAPTACGPSFFHSGQGCAMATRVLVQKDKHDAFVERMVGFTKIVTIGDIPDVEYLADMQPVVTRDDLNNLLQPCGTENCVPSGVTPGVSGHIFQHAQRALPRDAEAL